MQKIQELLDQNKILTEILPEGKFKKSKSSKLYNDPLLQKEKFQKLKL